MNGKLEEPLPNFNGEDVTPDEMRRLVQILERTLSNTGGVRARKVTVVNVASYNVAGDDEVLAVDRTATSAVTINLPPAAFLQGRPLTVYDTGNNASVNNITLDASGAETISGSGTYVISTNRRSVTIGSDGRNYMIEAVV